MKKLLILLSVFVATSANATDWWAMDTICRVDPDKCYASMGTGYDAALWDTGGGCWGMKMVCGGALTSATDEKVPYSKSQISSGLNKNSDFDFGLLNSTERCWGSRKTKDNGSKAMSGGAWVNVYCSGVLSDMDERLANGEIKLTQQPVCSDLAQDGWVIALNSNKCFGKKYAFPEYFIECSPSKELPDRIIALGGAPNFTTGSTGSGAPATASAASTITNQMYTTSRQKHLEKFGK